MKKILFILILTINSLYAKPCMTDIYFGNGVWNTDEQAIEGKTALRKLMHRAYNARLDRQEEGITYTFRHAYNPSHGTTDDLIETFYQLKESGQITGGYFFGVYVALAAESNAEEFLRKLQTIISNYDSDISQMYNIYNVASFKKKHNVLLVAHSQGNLFGNKMYTLMSDTQKDKFRMVSVATPANTSIGPYVTADLDYVIAGIPDHLSANVDGVGHTFIGTYLGSSFEARTQIALYVKNAYDNLVQTTTCTEYEFTRVWMPSYGLLNVYGNAEGKDELVGELILEQSDAILQNDNRTYKCPSEDSSYWGDDNYLGGNWTYNYKDDRYNSWIPGQYISSRSYLDDISGTNETVRKEDKCITISLEKDGDLYNIITDMFPE